MELVELTRALEELQTFFMERELTTQDSLIVTAYFAGLVIAKYSNDPSVPSKKFIEVFSNAIKNYREDEENEKKNKDIM